MAAGRGEVKRRGACPPRQTAERARIVALLRANRALRRNVSSARAGGRVVVRETRVGRVGSRLPFSRFSAATREHGLVSKKNARPLLSSLDEEPAISTRCRDIREAYATEL